MNIGNFIFFRSVPRSLPTKSCVRFYNQYPGHMTSTYFNCSHFPQCVGPGSTKVRSLNNLIFYSKSTKNRFSAGSRASVPGQGCTDEIHITGPSACSVRSNDRAQTITLVLLVQVNGVHGPGFVLALPLIGLSKTANPRRLLGHSLVTTTRIQENLEH